MARPRTYHQDRALTGAERARAFRERRKLRNETSPHPQRNETPNRNETSVTKPRNETPDRNETGARATGSFRETGGRRSAVGTPRGAEKWAGELGQRLVLEFNEEKKGRNDSKSVGDIIAILRSRPPWDKWSQETLLRKYFEARRLHGDDPPPIPAKPTGGPAIEGPQRDRWQSLLQKDGSSHDEACALVNLLIAKATAVHRLAYLPKLFDFVRRRTWYRGRKVAWLRKAAKEMEHRWPTMRERSDKTVRAILDALRDGPSTSKEIVTATGLNRSTVRSFLNYMCYDGDIVRIGLGRYTLPKEGLGCWIWPCEAVLKALAEGPATPTEICARVRLRTNQAAASLRNLKKRGKVMLIKHGVYALPGTDVAHVYAKDAIEGALRSGPKTVSQLVAITGKERSAISQALRRKKAKGEVIRTKPRVYALPGTGVSTRRTRRFWAQDRV
jgi:DNA-binding transcriptional ArsR family regulator